MMITRVFTGSDGETHFEDMEVALKDAGEIGYLSDPIATRTVRFRSNTPDYDYDWHTAPARQFVVLLDGEIDLEVSDGEKRRLSGGDVLLLEDTFGRGHRTRAVSDQPRRSVFITLPDDTILDVVQEASEESFPASDAPGWTGAAVT